MKVNINLEEIRASQIKAAKELAKNANIEEMKEDALRVVKHFYPSPSWRILELKATVQRNAYANNEFSAESGDLDITIDALLVDGSEFINQFAHVNFCQSASWQIAGDETPTEVYNQIYVKKYVRE